MHACMHPALPFSLFFLALNSHSHCRCSHHFATSCYLLLAAATSYRVAAPDRSGPIYLAPSLFPLSLFPSPPSLIRYVPLSLFLVLHCAALHRLTPFSCWLWLRSCAALLSFKSHRHPITLDTAAAPFLSSFFGLCTLVSYGLGFPLPSPTHLFSRPRMRNTNSYQPSHPTLAVISSLVWPGLVIFLASAATLEQTQQGLLPVSIQQAQHSTQSHGFPLSPWVAPSAVRLDWSSENAQGNSLTLGVQTVR